MSKKCIWCGGVVNPGLAGNGYYCPHCDEDLTEADVNYMTLFETITSSPDVLAKELVTTSYDEFKDCTVYWAWLGNGRREAYYSESEATAATLARLKEVEK